jgi:ribonuclease T1
VSNKLRLSVCAAFAWLVLLNLASSTAFSRGVSEEARTRPPIVALAQLPAEARETAALIARGGPFAYERDGVPFGNRERILPPRERGYYREYTVPTPGLRHRGARRIVAGRDGELYYTDDHYRTFKRILE